MERVLSVYGNVDTYERLSAFRLWADIPLGLLAVHRQALGRIARGFHYGCQQDVDAANGRSGAPYLAKTCCVFVGAGFEDPVPIAIGVRNALVSRTDKSNR